MATSRENDRAPIPLEFTPFISMTSILSPDLISGMVPPASAMLSVLKLFLIPAGGGIPAGVLYARSAGVAWPVTALLYLVSDVILALIFEPILRLLALLCGKAPLLSRVSIAMKLATARATAHYGGTGAGPIALIMIAFGVDPMTGRASALAVGHGFIAGWAIAIAGDMLYFAVIMLTTQHLNAYIKDPDTTMWIILFGMFCVPMAVRFVRSRRRKTASTTA